MKKLVLLVLALFFGVALGAPATRSANAAPTLGFVYTDDDNEGANTVTVFQVNKDGSLTNNGSVQTGGRGAGYNGTPNVSRTKVIPEKDMLFAFNDGDASISVFAGANSGNLALKRTFPSGQKAGFGNTLVAAGSCLIAAFSRGYNIISYKVLTYWPYLVKTSSASLGTGPGPLGISATKQGSNYYVAVARMIEADVFPVNPNTCGLGPMTALGAPANLATAVAFSPDGTKIYVAEGTYDPLFIVDEGPFPQGPLTLHSYSTGGTGGGGNLVVDKDGKCLYAGTGGGKYPPGVAGIPLIDGIPGPDSIFAQDLSGNWFAGNIAWHNSLLGFFMTTTRDYTDYQSSVSSYSVGPGCTPAFKTSVSTGQHLGSLYSLTADPQVGP